MNQFKSITCLIKSKALLWSTIAKHTSLFHFFFRLGGYRVKTVRVTVPRHKFCLFSWLVLIIENSNKVRTSEKSLYMFVNKLWIWSFLVPFLMQQYYYCYIAPDSPSLSLCMHCENKWGNRLWASFLLLSKISTDTPSSLRPFPRFLSLWVEITASIVASWTAL